MTMPDITLEKSLPCSLDAERAVLGAILLRRRFGLGEQAGAGDRAKAILDGIVRRQEVQDETSGGGEG